MFNNAFLHVHIFLVEASLNQCELGREVRTATKKEAEGFLAE